MNPKIVSVVNADPGIGDEHGQGSGSRNPENFKMKLGARTKISKPGTRPGKFSNPELGPARKFFELFLQMKYFFLLIIAT